MTGHILIADETATHRIILKARLTEAAYSVSLARSAEDLTARLTRDRPDVLLLSAGFSPNPLHLVEHLRGLAFGTELPIVLLTEDTGAQARINALRAGADMILPALPDTPVLRARIRSLMRRTAREADLGPDSTPEALLGFSEATADGFERPGQVAIIAENLAEGLKWRNGLTQQMRDRIAVLDAANALQELASMPAPDAFIVAEPQGEPEAALNMIAELYSRPETLHAAVLLAQRSEHGARAVAAFDMGVSDVVSDGFHPEEMAALLRREMARKAREDTRRAALRDGLRLAHTDPLTGLHNRRYALRHLNNVMRNAAETGQTFAILVLDLDRFKAVNDTFGHAAGDAVLQEVSRRVAGCMRRGDFVARIGGEEFLAVIRNCDLAAAQVAAERIRHTVAEAPIFLPGGSNMVSITTSIGMVIGGHGAATGSPSELVDLADRGLFAAKSEGRNQVTVYQAAA